MKDDDFLKCGPGPDVNHGSATPPAPSGRGTRARMLTRLTPRPARRAPMAGPRRSLRFGECLRGMGSVTLAVALLAGCGVTFAGPPDAGAPTGPAQSGEGAPRAGEGEQPATPSGGGSAGGTATSSGNVTSTPEPSPTTAATSPSGASSTSAATAAVTPSTPSTPSSVTPTVGATSTAGPAAAVVAAQQPIQAVTGGQVSVAGVTLSVPANALNKDGTASIQQTAAGIYNLHLDVPWTGTVTATLTLDGPGDAVVHFTDGAWTIESATLGDPAVDVTSLSPFSSLSRLVPACLRKRNLASIVASCLIQQGVTKISQSLARQIAGDDPCLQHLIDAGGAASVAVSMFTGACVGHAGEWWHDPATAPSVPTPAPVPPPVVTTPPSPLPPLVFDVQNTSETPPDGVWFRNSPHSNDTSRINGIGVYQGEQVQLRCFGWGDSVGPYHDTLWYQVDNLSRPNSAGTRNAGWLNAHYVADGLAANKVDAGVPPC